MPLMHIIGDVKNMYMTKVWCSNILVIRLVFFPELSIMQKWMLSASILLHGHNPSFSDNPIVYTYMRGDFDASTPIQYCKICMCESIHASVVSW